MQHLENYKEKYYVKYFVNQNEKERRIEGFFSSPHKVDKSRSRYGGKLENISQLKSSNIPFVLRVIWMEKKKKRDAKYI